MSAQAILILTVLAFAVGAVVGHVIGFRRGRDAEWCDEFFARIERDRSRPRDKDGRYVAIKGKGVAS